MSLTNKVNITGWGQHPKCVAEAYLPQTEQMGDLIATLNQWVPRGLGRSYGDSALAEQVVLSHHLKNIFRFDEKTGRLHCQSGVSLSHIIDAYLPRGWALPVTPGTKWVSVGGAIASDVHGKNHHHEGTFSQYVDAFELLLPSGQVITCSRTENADIFQATCGGMGLTGFILSAVIELMPVTSSLISQTTIKTTCFEETIELLQQYKQASYSVAWVDALARSTRLGRSLIFLGEHQLSGGLDIDEEKSAFFSSRLGAMLMSPLFLKIFNSSYYHKHHERFGESTLSWNKYFYPLDKLDDWHQLYGRSGFTQYQFIVPMDQASVVTQILKKIHEHGFASSLSVLKLCGKENENLLSFPMQGISLALDFKIKEGLWDLLDHLDAMVVDAGGRVYLAKDCRLNPERFRQMYPRYEEFLSVRDKVDPERKIVSWQSRRLKI